MRAINSLKIRLGSEPNSVTRLGDFEISWRQKFQQKKPKLLATFKAIWKPHCYDKTAVATSLVTFGNIWAIFYYNTWSHWSRIKIWVTPTRLPTLTNILTPILFPSTFSTNFTAHLWPQFSSHDFSIKTHWASVTRFG